MPAVNAIRFAAKAVFMFEIDSFDNTLRPARQRASDVVRMQTPRPTLVFQLMSRVTGVIHAALIRVVDASVRF